MKRALPLDSTIPLLNQIQIAILGPPKSAGQDAVSPYENLYSLVKHTISPYFNSCTRGESGQLVRHGKSMDDAKTGILEVESVDG
jgi:dynein heavy chain 1, cytosolic